MRARCANLDPRRASRWRHPAGRLYAEYIGGYLSAIRNAPLTPAERRACYGSLALWATGRIGPVSARALARRGLERPDPAPATGWV